MSNIDKLQSEVVRCGVVSVDLEYDGVYVNYVDNEKMKGSELHKLLKQALDAGNLELLLIEYSWPKGEFEVIWRPVKRKSYRVWVKSLSEVEWLCRLIDGKEAGQ